MQPLLRMALLAALLVATADALFTPRCLWSGLLGDLGSSGESDERWVRDTAFRTKDSRVRRFLWTDRDVCDWMCKGDYGSEVREVCSRCCPGSQPSSTSRRPSSTASTPPSTSRAPRSTVEDGTTTSQSTPAASAGTPAASAGTPAASAGTPAASAGTPAASAGTPAASAGTPAASAGTTAASAA
ncbi:translation initiation factor IF-2-like [Thrips palmi]|uniref:Translation initiation factor IF-2-like n=1 Tax=Thrips palmi TaxID=161013 RepID=A0A6P8ZWZ9_THRPL|nr:translation initiation factor IF-2-like [Thrips palmi]